MYFETGWNDSPPEFDAYDAKDGCSAGALIFVASSYLPNFIAAILEVTEFT